MKTKLVFLVVLVLAGCKVFQKSSSSKPSAADMPQSEDAVPETQVLPEEPQTEEPVKVVPAIDPPLTGTQEATETETSVETSVETATETAVETSTEVATETVVSTGTATEVTPPPPEPYVDVLGIKNYIQINETMAALTGVNPNNVVVKGVYDAVSGTLPLTNNLSSFSGANQVAISNLATEYCSEMVNSTTLRAQTLPGFDFGAVVATSFSQTGKALVVDILLLKFWAQPAARPENAETRMFLLTLQDEIIAEQTRLGRTNATATQNIVKGMCSAVLAAAPVTLL